MKRLYRHDISLRRDDCYDLDHLYVAIVKINRITNE